jgi:hypothetical protein
MNTTETPESNGSNTLLGLGSSAVLGPNAELGPNFERLAQVMAYRLGLAHAALQRIGRLSMTDARCVEALRIADRLDSSDPEFDDCADAAKMLRECVELARMEPAATELRIAATNALWAALTKDAARYRFVRTADKVAISSEAARDPVAYDAAGDCDA